MLNNAKAVIGLNFGDEGKGLVTDWLCMNINNPIVVRYSGGQNAGHTVYNEFGKHVFSNFGAGTLRGVPTYWARTCTVDPVGLMNEYNILIDKGAKPVIYIHEDCPVTTPFDIDYCQESKKYRRNGTTGVGFGTTIQREADFYNLTFGDLFHKCALGIKLESIRQYYDDTRGKDLKRFFEVVEEIKESCSGINVVKKPPEGYAPIFEGSQGLLLDQHIGFFPHVTRSSVGITKIDAHHIFLVTRAYQTRHGNGPMTTESLAKRIDENSEETNQTNEFQGVFRRQVLDLDLIKYALYKSRLEDFPTKSLVITCLDHVEGDWAYVEDGILNFCNSEDEFISDIRESLAIYGVLVSHSPYTENLKVWPGLAEAFH